MNDKVVDISKGREDRLFKQKDAKVESLREAFRASRESSDIKKKTRQSRMMDLLNRKKNKNKNKKK